MEYEWLVGGFKDVLFSIMYGIILPIYNIFQRGRYTTKQLRYRGNGDDDDDDGDDDGDDGDDDGDGDGGDDYCYYS